MQMLKSSNGLMMLPINEFIKTRESLFALAKMFPETTLQIPFALLAEERYHLLPLPKPYLGIHPKAMNVILAKNQKIFQSTAKMKGVYIPNRDMQSYDAFIPSLTAFVALSYIGHSMKGGLLWN